MECNITVFRIMIASPGDVLKERQATVAAIYQWNHLHANETKCVVLPLTWEVDVSPGVAAEPQELIDKKLLSMSDMVIGIFKSKLGRSAPTSLSYTVGEIKKHTDNGKQALLFFGQPSRASKTVQASEELTQLLRFKSDIKAALGKGALYVEYKSLTDFRTSISACLDKAIKAYLFEMKKHDTRDAHPSFAQVVVPRTTIQHKIQRARKSVFISGASLISTVTTSFDDCVRRDIQIKLVMTLEEERLIYRCAQLSYTSPEELARHIHTTLEHFGNQKRSPQIELKAIDAVMPFAMVGIDIDDPNGVIYVQQYLYETDPAKSPNYMCYYGDGCYSLYREQIEKLWNDAVFIDDYTK